MKLTFFSWGVLTLFFLAACSGLAAAPTQTATPVQDTQTPTATIVWFPPTDTPTFFPTQVLLSTPDQKPGLGDLLFTDSFDQPSLWSTSAGASASATVTRNQLLLSISGQGPLTIISLRSQPALLDFYAEATVSLSLCEGKDLFGMLFRAAPGDNYYRFAVSCEGQTRLERMVSDSLLPLNTWLSSGDAPIAAPAEVKLGVWVAGSEMRFFLNDHLQFTFRDPSLHSGTLGFFVYVNGAAPITASFTDLSVYSVAYVSPVPSLTPTRTPIPTRTSIPSSTPTP
ncbi:MAG: hypothetical protein ABSG01_01335 [Anaerolineales bacterium]|jgi:hypothetical protein